MKQISLNQIEDFLKSDTFVLFGVSQVKQKFGNIILRELSSKGIRVFPIHKELEEVEEIKCYQQLSELPEKVEAAIICTRPEKTDLILGELKTFGIRNIWLQQGASNQQIYEKAVLDFDNVVYDRCILMFAKQKGVHKFHATISKFFGSFPKRTSVVK